MENMMAKKAKRRIKKPLGEFGPPGEIKFKKPVAERKGRSALDRAAMVRESSKEVTTRKRK